MRLSSVAQARTPCIPTFIKLIPHSLTSPPAELMDHFLQELPNTMLTSWEGKSRKAVFHSNLLVGLFDFSGASGLY